MKGIGKDITINGNGLDMWFKAMLTKYPHSETANHLKMVWMMMAGETIHDNSLKTFFEKDLTK